MWEGFELKNWKNLPFIAGRVATELDVKNGIAVFYIESDSKPYDIELPLFALQSNSETNKKIPCVAIQIEETPKGIFIGVRYAEGGNGIGSAEEFELFSEVPEEFTV